MVKTVPSKGIMQDEFLGRTFARAIDSIGLAEIVTTMKGDHEPSLVIVRDAVIKCRTHETKVGTIEEDSPEGDSASNGVAEQAVKRCGRHDQDDARARRDRTGPEDAMGFAVATVHGRAGRAHHHQVQSWSRRKDPQPKDEGEATIQHRHAGGREGAVHTTENIQS